MTLPRTLLVGIVLVLISSCGPKDVGDSEAKQIVAFSVDARAGKPTIADGIPEPSTHGTEASMQTDNHRCLCDFSMRTGPPQ